MQTSRALSRCKQTCHVRHLGISVHLDTSHHVVGCRTNFHRLLGNVNVGKLLELVIHTGQLLLYMLGRVRNSLLDPRNVQEYTAVRTAAPFSNLLPDAAGYVVTSQQFGRASRVLVTLRIPRAFFFGVGGRVGVQRRNIFEHESLAIPITQHPSLAAHSLRDQNATHTWWPNHSRGMELHEFHIHQRSTSMVGERMAIARIFPTVAGDFECSSNSSCRQHHGFGTEQVKSATLAVVSKRARDATAVLQQRDDCVFHENVETEMDAMVLKS